MLTANVWEKRAMRVTIEATENFMILIFSIWKFKLERISKYFWYQWRLLSRPEFIWSLCNKNITTIVCCLLHLKHKVLIITTAYLFFLVLGAQGPDGLIYICHPINTSDFPLSYPGSPNNVTLSTIPSSHLSTLCPWFECKNRGSPCLWVAHQHLLMVKVLAAQSISAILPTLLIPHPTLLVQSPFPTPVLLLPVWKL